jgi:hypothetical protein
VLDSSSHSSNSNDITTSPISIRYSPFLVRCVCAYSTSEQKNYKDANLREVARDKVNAARLKSDQKTDDQTPKYRDRASERRVMHNQPDAPAPSSSSGGGSSGNGRRSAPGPPKPPSPPPPPLNPGQDENNVGNKLLKMMGWTEGTGLGTNGEGRVDPMYGRASLPSCFSRSPALQTNCYLCTGCRARGIQG